MCCVLGECDCDFALESKVLFVVQGQAVKSYFKGQSLAVSQIAFVRLDVSDSNLPPPVQVKRNIWKVEGNYKRIMELHMVGFDVNG